MRTRLASLMLCLLVSEFPAMGICQQKTPNKTVHPAPASDYNFAKPLYWGPITVNMFKDTGDQLTLSLATSWIPGEDHNGRFRYRIHVSPKLAVEQPLPTQGSDLLERASGCSVWLDLFDGGGFQLRSILIQFNKEVDGQLTLVGLIANDSAQMDKEEYQLFVDGTGGTWNISWKCSDSSGGVGK